MQPRQFVQLRQFMPPILLQPILLQPILLPPTLLQATLLQAKGGFEPHSFKRRACTGGAQTSFFPTNSVTICMFVIVSEISKICRTKSDV